MESEYRQSLQEMLTLWLRLLRETFTHVASIKKGSLDSVIINQKHHSHLLNALLDIIL